MANPATSQSDAGDAALDAAVSAAAAGKLASQRQLPKKGTLPALTLTVDVPNARAMSPAQRVVLNRAQVILARVFNVDVSYGEDESAEGEGVEPAETPLPPRRTLGTA